VTSVDALVFVLAFLVGVALFGEPHVDEMA